MKKLRHQEKLDKIKRYKCLINHLRSLLKRNSPLRKLLLLARWKKRNLRTLQMKRSVTGTRRERMTRRYPGLWLAHGLTPPRLYQRTSTTTKCHWKWLIQRCEKAASSPPTTSSIQSRLSHWVGALVAKTQIFTHWGAFWKLSSHMSWSLPSH